MKNVFTFCVAFTLFSCVNQDKDSYVNDTSLVDTLGSSGFVEKEVEKGMHMDPDYFPISDLDFVKFKSDNSQWFIDTSNNNKLYLIPYTDYSITCAILTNLELHDDTLISGLLESEGIRYRRMDKAIHVDSIRSKFGVKLGLSLTDVLAIFGKPKLENSVENMKTVTWQFTMVETSENDSHQVGGLRPFIMNGLGFEVSAVFMDNRLSELIYWYEVP